MKPVAMVLCLYCTASFALAPPDIIWERTYFGGYNSSFYNVHETSDGGFITAGFLSLEFGFPPVSSLFRFNSDGDLLWVVDLGFYYQSMRWVEQLPDNGFIATGACKLSDSTSYALALIRLDSDGQVLWTKVYDYESSREWGYCVLPLSDGGFAIGGRVHGSGSVSGNAWILRTDSAGDTLWTVEINLDINTVVRRIFLVDGILVAYLWGPPSGSTGPVIVGISMDGEVLWEASDFPTDFGSYGISGDMCYSPSDNGLTFVTGYFPWIAHTDNIGVLDWFYPVPGTTQPWGYSVNTTMDQGYIYGGQNTPNPDIPGSTYSGMIVKFDSEGNVIWGDYVYNSNCMGINSVQQLSQGGYIAAGRTTGADALLIRYEPETGIEEPGPSSAITLSVSPNPFTLNLSISYSLPEPTQVELSVYDLSGRLVDELPSGTVSAGYHISVWNPDPALPDGCYLIVLDACGERVAQRCVKLD
jgi:hypothetical protein